MGRIVNRFSKDQNTVDEALPRAFQSYMRQFASVMTIFVVISYSTPIFLAAIVPLGTCIVHMGWTGRASLAPCTPWFHRCISHSLGAFGRMYVLRDNGRCRRGLLLRAALLCCDRARDPPTRLGVALADIRALFRDAQRRLHDSVGPPHPVEPRSGWQRELNAVPSAECSVLVCLQRVWPTSAVYARECHAAGYQPTGLLCVDCGKSLVGGASPSMAARR